MLRVRVDDPEYQRLAAAEAAFWDQPQPFSLECLEQTFDDGPIERYVNRRFTGNPDRGWYDIICDYGPFHRGVVLGTSGMSMEARILQSNPSLHLTFVDISPGAVERRADQLGSRFPGRVETRIADLNFIELEPAAYDVVISSASLHHVINLEWLAKQIAIALRPGGYAFIQDYVGEPRFQFAEPKRRLFEVFHDGFAHRLDPTRQTGIIWRDSSDLSPFCGVRSDEVLGTMGAQLTPLTVRTASAMLVPFARACAADAPSPPQPRWPRRLLYALDDGQRRVRGLRPRMRQILPAFFFRELFALDEVLCDAGVVLPGVAFAIYRQR